MGGVAESAYADDELNAVPIVDAAARARLNRVLGDRITPGIDTGAWPGAWSGGPSTLSTSGTSSVMRRPRRVRNGQTPVFHRRPAAPSVVLPPHAGVW